MIRGPAWGHTAISEVASGVPHPVPVPTAEKGPRKPAPWGFMPRRLVGQESLSGKQTCCHRTGIKGGKSQSYQWTVGS